MSLNDSMGILAAVKVANASLNRVTQIQDPNIKYAMTVEIFRTLVDIAKVGGSLAIKDKRRTTSKDLATKQTHLRTIESADDTDPNEISRIKREIESLNAAIDIDVETEAIVEKFTKSLDLHLDEMTEWFALPANPPSNSSES